MANKNDTSDLVIFLSWTAGIIIAVILLLSSGYAYAEKKYGKDIRYWQACVSNYVMRQWDEAKAAGD